MRVGEGPTLRAEVTLGQGVGVIASKAHHAVAVHRHERAAIRNADTTEAALLSDGHDLQATGAQGEEKLVVDVNGASVVWADLDA